MKIAFRGLLQNSSKTLLQNWLKSELILGWGLKNENPNNKIMSEAELK
ncbi:hypothetical protein GJV14_23490 [Enterobacteriaceae bacterium RIT697]|nr:hypothetical protein [Enterobacteriaceae bacterium RIT697]